VVIFCIPPLTRGQDLRNNLPLPPLLIRLLRHIPRNTLLLGIMIEDSGSVLGARVWTLAVQGCWVMHLVEEFKQLAVCDLVRVECNLQSFGI
jgi:hypothetical protein